MSENTSIEKRVVDTVLERQTDTLNIDGREYPLAPPTLGTIIMVSELVATLPRFNMEQENLLYEIMKEARNCQTLGKIAAVLILGAKRVKENRKVPTGRMVEIPAENGSYFSRIFRSRVRKARSKETIAEVDKLAETVLNEVSPATLHALVSRRLLDMQITDFFGLTTSLTTKNQIEPTREVGDEATVSGE